MNEMNENVKKKSDTKRIVKIIVTSIIGALVLLALLIWLIDSLVKKDVEYETLPPVDPSKLHETKDEDFDIMEYGEYLAFDRSIYLNDKSSGVTQSVREEDCDLFGDGFGIMYRVIVSINEGDHVSYNYYMGKNALKKDEFTQQQIYDIEIIPQSFGEVVEDGVSYDEYIFKVTYRIHENNGTYRNTIESDVSRPQYFIINNSTGVFKVMDIIEQGYKK